MTYYCNCEADCIHKSKRLKKVKTLENGKIKVQICLNPHKDCTCKYQVSLGKAFGY